MTPATVPFIDVGAVAETLQLLVAPGQPFELRIIEPHSQARWKPRALFGYFDKLEAAIAALKALQFDGAKGVCVTLNPVDAALLARCHNRLSDGQSGGSTSDQNITRRRWLMIDVDAKRPSGVSATDSEKSAAERKVRQVEGFLESQGWPEPVLADSGNGFHLLYRIDEPTDCPLIKQCLETLAKLMDDDKATIDVSVHNPARLVRLYGSRSEKGEHAPQLGRPHRLSRLVQQPETLEIVPTQLLQELAKQAPAASVPQAAARNGMHMTARNSTARAWSVDRVQQFIDAHLSDCRPRNAQPYQGGYKWVLDICPFNSDHANASALITRDTGGKLGFACHHNSCQGYDWKALRAKYEPSVSPASRVQLSVMPSPSEALAELETQHGEPIHHNGKGAPISINQVFLANKFASENEMLFEPNLNTFYAYELKTGLWQEVNEKRMAMHLSDAFQEMVHLYECPELLKFRNENYLSQLTRMLKGVMEKPGIFNRSENIIHVGNGFLRLENGMPVLGEFRPDFYSRNRTDIPWDPNAECPRFINELLGQLLAPDDISLLQRLAGQFLLGRNLSQRILLLRGTPGGGKSTLANVLETIIGTHNVAQLRTMLLDERFEIAGFVGKTLLCGKDVPGDFLNQKAAYQLKALVGNDRMTVERKGANKRFELIGDFNVLIIANSRLRVRLDSDSGAWKRRLVIIDCNLPPVTHSIPYFDQLLITEEGPGILNWCVQGALRLLEELEQHRTILLTPEQEQRIETLLSESDSVRHFIKHCVKKEHGADVTVHELATAYSKFCEDRGWQAMSTRQFENVLRDLMMEIHRVPKRTDVKRNEKSQRGFVHVALIPEEEP